MNLIETTDSQLYVYKGRIINVRNDKITLPDGKPAEREVVEHNGGVAIVALTDDGDILLVEQFRYPYMKTVLEIPAGKLDKGEDPLSAAKRELSEETGANAKKWESLGEYYPTPGYTNEIIHLFYASKLNFGKQNPDEDEFLMLKKMPLSQAVNMIIKNEIPDGKTQTAVLKMYCSCQVSGVNFQNL